MFWLPPELLIPSLAAAVDEQGSFLNSAGRMPVSAAAATVTVPLSR